MPLMIPSRRFLLGVLAGILARSGAKAESLDVAAGAAGTSSVADQTKNAPGLFVPDQTIFEGSISVGNGLRSLRRTHPREGSWNTAIGVNALLNATDQWAQTAVGYNALRDSGRGPGVLGTTPAVGNTAIGCNSMVVNVSGVDNTAVGVNTLLNNESGADNAAFGINALKNNSSGYGNTAIGFDTAMNLLDGHMNVALGGHAGRFLSDSETPKLHGNTSIYIGYKVCGGFIDSAENEIVIGAFATGEGSNTIVLGNWAITDTYLKGKVHLNGDLAIAGTPTSGGVEIGYRDIPRVTSGLERGKAYATSSNVTISPGSAAGSNYTIYNDSSSAVTIEQGSGLTLRWAGTTSTGERTLAARGFVTVWFNSAQEAVIQGAGLS